MYIFDVGRFAAHRTAQRVAALGRVLQELALEQPRHAVLAEAVQAGDVASRARENEDGVAGMRWIKYIDLCLKKLKFELKSPYSKFESNELLI